MNRIDTFTYANPINLTSGGAVIVEMGCSDDILDVDPSITGVTFYVYGGQGSDEIDSFDLSNAIDATVAPSNVAAVDFNLATTRNDATIAFGTGATATTIQALEFEDTGLIFLAGFDALDYQMQKFLGDDYTLAFQDDGFGNVAGTISGSGGAFNPLAICPTEFVGVTNVAVDCLTGNTADTLNVSSDLGLATGMQTFLVSLGPGADTLNLQGTNFNFDTGPGTGLFVYDGGSGIDTMASSGDIDWFATDNDPTAITGLVLDAGGPTALNGQVQLVNLDGGAGGTDENLDLGGGAGANTIWVNNWSGNATLTGNGGGDTLILGDAADVFSGFATLNGDDPNNLLGSAGNNVFCFSQVSGFVQANGGLGNDSFYFGMNNNFNLVTGDINIASNWGTDLIDVDDSGNSTSTTYNVSNNTFTTSQSPTATVSFDSNLELIFISGTSDADQFVVTPSLFSQFILNGNDPIVAPGDHLAPNFAGDKGGKQIITGVNAGYYTFASGQKQITYTSMETADPPPITTLVAASADIGKNSKPLVKVYILPSPNSVLYDFYAYAQANPASFRGGVRVVLADVTGDGVPDVITAPGPGIAGEVKVFDGKILANDALLNPFIASPNNALIADFFPEGTAYKNGLYVAAGDVNGDGTVDIITSRSAGSPLVRVFLTSHGTITGASDTAPITITTGSTENLHSGDKVAVENVSGNTAAIGTWTAAGVTGTTFNLSGSVGNGVFVSDGKGTWISFNQSIVFAPYTAKEKVATGAVVTAGDLDGDGVAEIVTAPGAGSVFTVKEFDYANFIPYTAATQQGVVTRQFLGMPSTYKLGGSLAIGDVNGDGLGEIIFGAGSGGGSQVRVYDQFGDVLSSFKAYTGGNVNAPVRLTSHLVDGFWVIFTGQANDGRNLLIKGFEYPNPANLSSPTLVDSFLETQLEFSTGVYMG